MSTSACVHEIQIDTSQIPKFRKEELGKAALLLVEQVFSLPGAEEKYQAWLANAELRHWKNLAHEAFDPLWKYGRFKGDRDAAYRWLSQQMGIPYKKTHIGMFDVAECKAVIDICSRKELAK